jgi:formate dehydrogenase iron-sulfur subunit
MAATKMGVLVDLTRCIGCRACQVACKNWNQLEAEQTTFFSGPAYQNPPGLSDRTFTYIQYFELPGGPHPVDLKMVKRQCLHCDEPACANACLVGALKKTESGPVVYDESKCMGCRYCMVACPFDVPTFEWSRTLPLIRKCTFCADRQSEGLQPACVTTCPTGALRYGPRQEMVVEAHRRIVAAPGKYVNHVYGEREMGGTSWIYLSPVSFASLGFRTDLGTDPARKYTAKMMESVPFAFAGVAAAMAGMWWFSRRRAEVTGSSAPAEKAGEGEKGDTP